jgi:flagellar basal-body rod modification protein FlgD
MAVITGADNYKYSPISTAGKKEKAAVIDNPSGALTEDGFLKLFIETLKNQSIDSTTDIKEIMQYTANMTTVQTNNANKKALDNVVKTLKNNSNYSTQYGLLPAIGKIAITKLDLLKFDGQNTTDFTLFAPEKMKNATMEIKNQAGATLREIPLEKYVNSVGIEGKDDKGIDMKDIQGLLYLSWDGQLIDGTLAEKGDYKVNINYKDEKGLDKRINLGEYKVQSVKFKEGTLFLNVGQFDVAFNDILELKDN